MAGCMALFIGGSAGSLEVLLKVLPAIKESASFAIIIILHRKPGIDILLQELFSAKTKIPVLEIEEKGTVLPGHIYLAPSDYHLLIERDKTFSLDRSEKVNYSRPSIDVGFESGADCYKEKMAALLLSGANADGVRGLLRVKKLGGRVAIQDPDTAMVPYMPAQAKLIVSYDDMLRPEQMADWINDL